MGDYNENQAKRFKTVLEVKKKTEAMTIAEQNTEVVDTSGIKFAEGSFDSSQKCWACSGQRTRMLITKYPRPPWTSSARQP